MKTRKRVISLLLTACMMLSLCAALPFAVSAETVSSAGGWDGTTATEPAGTGTQADPYLISSAANLLWLQKQIPRGDTVNDQHADVLAGKYTAKFAGMYFLQTQDIDLNGKNFASIGYYFANAKRTASFGGTYDGQGYAIRNGKIISQNDGHGLNVNWGHGLFGVIHGATIKNIVLDNVQVEGNGVTGAIVGRAAATADDKEKGETLNIIENCVVNANCTVTAKYPTSVDTAKLSADYDQASRVGGIVGMAYGTTVRYCVNHAAINVPGNWVMTGGIVGSAGYNTTVEYCVNTGKITYDLATYQNKAECAVGGIVGFISPYSAGVVDKTLVGNTVIRNCYNSGIFHLNMGTNVVGNALYWGGILGGANSLSKATNKIEDCYNLHALRKGQNGIAANVTGNNYRFGGLLGSYWIPNGADVGVLEVLNSASVDIDENAYEGSNQCRYWKRENNDKKLCVEETTSKQDTAENITPLTNAIDESIRTARTSAVERKVIKVAYQNETAGGSTAVRFSAQIFGTEYERVGFRIWASYSDGTVSAEKDVSLHTYYTSLKANGASVTPDEGYNFIAFVVENIPTDKGDVTFTMVPYAVDLNGRMFCGDTATVTFPVAAGEQ